MIKRLMLYLLLNSIVIFLFLGCMENKDLNIQNNDAYGNYLTSNSPKIIQVKNNSTQKKTVSTHRHDIKNNNSLKKQKQTVPRGINGEPKQQQSVVEKKNEVDIYTACEHLIKEKQKNEFLQAPDKWIVNLKERNNGLKEKLADLVKQLDDIEKIEKSLVKPMDKKTTTSLQKRKIELLKQINKLQKIVDERNNKLQVLELQIIGNSEK